MKRTLSFRQLSRSNFSSTSVESVSTQVAMVSTTFSSDILPAPTSSKLYLVVGALLLFRGTVSPATYAQLLSCKHRNADRLAIDNTMAANLSAFLGRLLASEVSHTAGSWSSKKLPANKWLGILCNGTCMHDDHGSKLHRPSQGTAVDQKASLQTAARYQKTEESRD